MTLRRGCRVCGSLRLTPYLDFGLQPLANSLRTPDAPLRSEYRAPLKVVACPQCKLSQLTYVVPREVMYTNYVYRSGTSPAWRTRCAELAAQYAKPGAHVVEIASNDGTLLREFAARGCLTLGVEPATDFAGEGVLTEFWSAKLAGQLPPADVLVAQNVLGHVDDVHDFMEGIATALAPNGLAIIEVPYLGKLFDNLAFDTVYHEHLSYWSVTALKTLAEAHNLVLVDVQPQPVHGGSIRVLLARSGRPRDVVTRYLVAEHEDFRRQTYLNFSARVTRRIADISEALSEREYLGYGAAAKTSVMLGCLDVRSFPRAVIDETPGKHGLRIPGTQVPIVAPLSAAEWRALDVPLVIFAWNWASDIIPRVRRAGFTGPILVPNPRMQWHESSQ